MVWAGAWPAMPGRGRVVRLADQHEIVAALGERPGLGVDPGDQRTGRVDDLEPARRGLGLHLSGHAVRREDHGCPVRNLVQRGDEDRALGGQLGDRLRVGGQLAVDVHGAAAGHGAAAPRRAPGSRRCTTGCPPPAACGSRPRPTTRPPPTRPRPQRPGPPRWPRPPIAAVLPSRCAQVATKTVAPPPSSARVGAVRRPARNGPASPLRSRLPAHQRRGRARQRAAHRVPDLGRRPAPRPGPRWCRAPGIRAPSIGSSAVHPGSPREPPHVEAGRGAASVKSRSPSTAMPAGSSFPGKYPVSLKGFSSFGYGNEPVPSKRLGNN